MEVGKTYTFEVLQADSDFLILRGCATLTNNAKSNEQVLVVQTTSQSPVKNLQDRIKDELQSLKLDRTKLMKIDQESCDYPSERIGEKNKLEAGGTYTEDIFLYHCCCHFNGYFTACRFPGAI